MKPSPPTAPVPFDRLLEARTSPDQSSRLRRWQVAASAWLSSLVLHALLVVILGYTFTILPRGTQAQPGAELVASINTDDLDGEMFEDEHSTVAVTASTAEQPSAAQQPSGGPISEIFDDRPPVDASSALPGAMELSGLAGTGGQGPATGAGDFTGGPRQPARIQGGKARTKVYGVVGEGNAFVYVFDRSGSMGGGSTSPLNAAKTELMASLDNLGDTNQFQIIFYNEKPTVMPVGRQRGGLLFGTEANKKLAQSFVSSIRADGGTRHEEALQKALRLAPDVVFFLTDADQPELSAGQLADIKRRNGGRSSVNTIEFGLGPAIGRENFLVRLARENGGQYVYIDISRYRSRD
ncbi:MAG: VWA domain-containing protein [Pirellulales bacterium]